MYIYIYIYANKETCDGLLWVKQVGPINMCSLKHGEVSVDDLNYTPRPKAH